MVGAARAVAALQPPGVEAHFVVAACENMINERSIVPSDILTASNGKTIEVLNTDAVSCSFPQCPSTNENTRIGKADIPFSSFAGGAAHVGRCFGLL